MQDLYAIEIVLVTLFFSSVFLSFHCFGMHLIILRHNIPAYSPWFPIHNHVG